MGKKLLGVALLGLAGAAYVCLYNLCGDAHRGLFVFGSLLAVLTVKTAGRG